MSSYVVTQSNSLIYIILSLLLVFTKHIDKDSDLSKLLNDLDNIKDNINITSEVNDNTTIAFVEKSTITVSQTKNEEAIIF